MNRLLSTFALAAATALSSTGCMVVPTRHGPVILPAPIIIDPPRREERRDRCWTDDRGYRHCPRRG